MGKKPIFKPNPNTAVPPRPVDALLSAFDPRADHFAIVTQAVDRHHLRIFDTHTATVKCDFSLEKEKFTCLTWGVMQAEREFGGPPPTPSKKKKRRSTTSNPTTQVLALGLHNGSVAIYSLAQGSVVKTLSGSHTAPINDFVFTNDGCRGYSVAEDHHVVEWDVEEGREISNWKADIKSIKKIALSYGETKLLAAGHTIKMWDLDTRTVVKKFTGHASAITSIVFSANDTICASTAEHDRYINIWDCTLSSTNDTEFGNLTALILDTDVTHLAINSSNTILAIAEDGSMGLWQNANSPTSATAQAKNPPAKKRRSTTRPSDAVVRIVSTVDGRTVVPILKAAFVGGDESGTVLIARGSTVKPVFEKVRYLKEDTGAFLEEITLSRHLVTGFLIDDAASKLKATQKGYDESSVVVLGTTDFGLPDASLGPNADTDQDDHEPTIEEKLKDLAVDEPTASASKAESKKSKPAVPKYQMPKANSLQQMLVQALHSNDAQMLEACLSHSNPEIIKNTVRRLPTTYVIPFLTQIVIKFQQKPNRGEALLEWIKAVLLIHTAYLMTVPDLVKALSALYQTLDSRLLVFQKLLQLHGRLDLMMSQISMRAKYLAEDTTNEAVTVYVEEEEENDDDDDEEEVDEDEDEKGETTDEDEDMMDLVGDADVFEGKDEEEDEEENPMANDTDEEEAESEMSVEDEDEDEDEDDD